MSQAMSSAQIAMATSGQRGSCPTAGRQWVQMRGNGLRMGVSMQSPASSSLDMGYSLAYPWRIGMSAPTLSAEQAFQAMIRFLDAYHDRAGRRCDLASVLSDIQTIASDGRPADS